MAARRGGAVDTTTVRPGYDDDSKAPKRGRKRLLLMYAVGGLLTFVGAAALGSAYVDSSATSARSEEEAVSAKGLRLAANQEPFYTGAAGKAAAAAVSMARASVVVVDEEPQQPKPVVAQPPSATAAWSLPASCVTSVQYNPAPELHCYTSVAEQSAKFSDGVCQEKKGSGPSLFHTLSLGPALPSQAALSIHSFLATQCDCDSQLTVWMRPGSLASSALPQFALPQGHAHRVVFKELDLRAHWELSKAELDTAVNATTRDWVMGLAWPPADVSEASSDEKFQSDWLRILLLWQYGGVFVELDTVFLRDWRPLLQQGPAPWSYRGGVGSGFDNAVLHLPAKPDPFTRRVLVSTLAAHHAAPDYITQELLGYTEETGIGSSAFRLMAGTLFDFVGQRREGGSHHTDAFKAVMPEFKREAGHGTFFASMPSADAEARADAPFFSGSFSYHWRNRFGLDLPPSSWASILLARFKRQLSQRSSCE